MTVCERENCGHPLGRHMAAGGCIIEGCDCSGFHMLSDAENRAQAKAAKLTRCSGCGRRVRSGGPHGSMLDAFGHRATGIPCPRKGMGPDRAESWMPSR